jgi:hypothetical protein
MPIVSKADFLKAAARSIAGHSHSRQAWERAKDAAKNKGLDVGTFKNDLGPALDSVRDIVENVNELMRLHNVKIENADKEWKDAIKQRVDRARKILSDYQKECDRKNDAQKKEWEALKTVLKSVVPANTNTLLRPWKFNITT